ncbi:hypothetical protein [Pedobacter sp. SYP-B3415]|uniref:hypothetical protein n=1 Tax=Pedobacter sp. SYP-B3415 TaxID=2496641 RepID=UPI00101E1BBE|nr:hypothetical protein [Pedobacter sp. SYP-B3415]
MKIRLIFLLVLVTLGPACKKEPRQSDYAGTWVVNEVEIYNPPSTTPYPSTQGEHGTITVSFAGMTEAVLQLRLYDQTNTLRIDESYQAVYGKDEDGDPYFKAEGTGEVLAYVFDKEMDFYGITGARIAAKK